MTDPRDALLLFMVAFVLGALAVALLGYLTHPGLVCYWVPRS
jgi:hypothetical protein